VDAIFAIISRNIGEILLISSDFFYGCKNDISTDFPLIKSMPGSIPEISEKTAKISSERRSYQST
jgi:hypothetical protein